MHRTGRRRGKLRLLGANSQRQGQSGSFHRGHQSVDGTLHAVQQAFIDENSPQCGFCTPGQVMSAVALLNSNPRPTREEVRAGLSGNLCRCGAYEHYINGVLRASRQIA